MVTKRKIASNIVQFHSPELTRLASEERDKCTSSLHLTSRAFRLLRKKRITKIGQLVDAAVAGFSLLKTGGGESFDFVLASLHALAQSISKDGTIDWMHYAFVRGFVILPISDDPYDGLRRLPEALGAAVKLRFGSNEIRILEGYLFQKRPGSLKRLSTELRITKQGVLFARDSMMVTLQGAIFEDNYTDLPFRFRPNFVAPLRTLKALIERKGNVVPYGDAQQLIEEIFEVNPTEWGSARDFAFELIDYPSPRNPASLSKAFLFPRSTSRIAVDRSLRQVKRFLRVEVPAGLTKAELMERLTTAGDTRQTIEIVSALVDLVPEFERTKAPRRLQVPLADLPRITDQLQRILCEKGKPTHTRELAEAVGAFAGRSGSRRTHRHLGRLMSTDPRFSPLGHNGVWTLTEWNLERSTVADISARLLLKMRRPMAERELYAKIRAVRSVARRSLSSLLREDGRFRRIASGTWELRRG